MLTTTVAVLEVALPAAAAVGYSIGWVWQVRACREWKAAKAKAMACIERLENPEMPARYRAGLGKLAAVAAQVSGAEREAGLQLADHLRKCFGMPDVVLAAVLVEAAATAFGAVESIASPDPLGTLASILGVAAAELTALDRELAG
jgi:hypothetical protein